MQDLGDLGTPSAPPINDTGREERSFELDGQQQSASEGLTEMDFPGEGICPSNVSEAFQGSNECLSERRAQSLETNELGKRYCSC